METLEKDVVKQTVFNEDTMKELMDDGIVIDAEEVIDIKEDLKALDALDEK